MILDLLSTNAGSRLLRDMEELRIIGSCITVEWPSISGELCDFDGVCLSACPERDHINLISLKIASMLSRINIKRVRVLTVDGSPHCLHLHHAVEEAIRVTGSQAEVEHLVVYGGRMLRVSRRAVKLARYLSKVERFLEEYGEQDSDN